MLEFVTTKDPYALEVMRDGELCAEMYWHPSSAPRVVVGERGNEFTLDDLRQLTEKLAWCVATEKKTSA